MRICCISDLHGHLPAIPPCDLVLLAGDLVPTACHGVVQGRRWLDSTFRAWLKRLPSETAVVGVAGNHDFVFQDGRSTFEPPLAWTYLQDSGATIGGLSIWGTPWQPTFYNWAFNLDEEDLIAKWELIPEGIDVLLLHGPPLGHGDRTPRGSVGSPSLLKRIQAIRPRLAVAGHIHAGYGVYEIGSTTFVNASHLDNDYVPAHRPVVLDLTDDGVVAVDFGPL